MEAVTDPPFAGLNPAPIPLLIDGEAGPSWGEMAEVSGKKLVVVA